MPAVSGTEKAGSAEAAVLRRAVQAVRAREGVLALVADGADRPDITLIDRRVGLHAIDLALHVSSGDDRAPFVRVNRKRAELRESLADIGPVGIGAAVVLPAHVLRPSAETTSSRTLLEADLRLPDWPDMLSPRPLDEETFDRVVERLAPAVVFTRHSRRTTVDTAATERAAMRIHLDGDQVRAALAPIDDVAMVTGPPGSGKTLLLAARARHLAAAHPGWQIAVVVFNHALVPYLRTLIGTSEVTVATVGGFAHERGLRVVWDGGPAAIQELARARRRGIDRTVDALLIDESQDFDAAWLELLLDTVRPGRGGTLLAGDAAQGLYRELDVEAALSRRHVVRTTLCRPYRSTRSILRVAQALTPNARVDGVDDAPEGEAVDLIWASSWDEQAACVAAEIEAMIVDGLRRPCDIAVLVTRRAGALRRLRDALDGRQIVYEQIDRTNAATFDAASSTVKVLTVHSGKGHEFPVVVLFGLETLPAVVDDETRRQERVGFVGATRAVDQLVITYTRTNPHLERLIALGDDVRRWTWPDDYEDA